MVPAFMHSFTFISVRLSVRSFVSSVFGYDNFMVHAEYLKPLVPAFSLTFVELNCLESGEFENLLQRSPAERRLFRRYFAWVALILIMGTIWYF